MRILLLVVSLLVSFRLEASLEYEQLDLEGKVASSDYIGLVRATDEYFDQAPLPGDEKLLPANVNIVEIENIYGSPPEYMHIKDRLGNARADCCERNAKYLVFLQRHGEDKFVPVTTFDAVFKVGFWHVIDFSEPGSRERNVRYSVLKDKIIKLLGSKEGERGLEK